MSVPIARAARLCVVLAVLTLTGAAQAVDLKTFSDDFSLGLNPVVWSIENTDGSYAVDATHGDVRLSHPLAGGYGYKAVRVRFNGVVTGDYDTQVTFRDAKITLADYSGQAANQIAFHAFFGGLDFAATRDHAVVEGNNYHVYTNPPGVTLGVTPNTDLQGTLRLTRIGNITAGYFNNAKIYENTYSTGPANIYFTLENNQTRDSTAVTYDNFSITADRIQGIPEPATGLLMTAAGVLLLRRRL
jgi:hypothetical protein